MTPPERRPAAAESAGVARAWGWVAHLRTGGTTPWSQWQQPAPPAAQSGRYLPGAQQLELLRRLNLVGPPAAGLADRVLTASAPGRGLPDLGLEGVLPPSSFGSPPVDPSGLAPEELVRVATALLAEDVVAAGGPDEPRGVRLFRRRYRMLGDPELARPIREALIADGRPPGGPSATVVVLGTGIDRMLAHEWTARSFGAGVRPWREYLAGERRRTSLSPRLDLAAVAQYLGRPGRQCPRPRRRRRHAPGRAARRPAPAGPRSRSSCRPTRSSWPGGRLLSSAPWSLRSAGPS